MTGSELPELAWTPPVTQFTETFWRALDEGRLLTTRCLDCAGLTFPPKPICPACWGGRVEWVSLAGRGWLRSFTEVWTAPRRFAPEVPYVLGLVDLEEGLRLLSRIRAAYEELSVDQPVELVIRRARPVSLFEFRPAQRSSLGAAP